MLVRRQVGDILVLFDSDLGRWQFAAGPEFPDAGLPPAHDGAVFFRTDLGAHYYYDAGTWTLIGGAAGAPTDAEYVVGAAHGDLSAERVLTDTATVTWDLTTPGQAKANALGAPAPDNDARFLALAGV